MTYDVHIIGGGLGTEAAWQLGKRGFKVRLSEMRGTGERSPRIRATVWPNWYVPIAAQR
jgi:folate-dependent tRNA-U54 methylase TrmFO/GidA